MKKKKKGKYLLYIVSRKTNEVFKIISYWDYETANKYRNNWNLLYMTKAYIKVI